VSGILSAAPSLQRPVLYSPQHLRRWRAALALADQQVIPLVYCGDSIPWGTGADGTTSTTNAVALVKGICGRLQADFSYSPRTLQANPGEGFILANDSRVSTAGSPGSNLYACTAFAQGYRLIGATQQLSLAIPAGVTAIGVVQANTNAAFNSGGSGLADVTGQYEINAGGFNPLTTLTNTNLPIVTTIAVAGGNTFTVEGPATAQTYISGFILSTSAATGVQVHRVCQNGAVSGSLLGTQNSGALIASAANQIIAARACYAFNTITLPISGLIIVEFSVNDQHYQNGGGTAQQNGVTISLYQQWIQQFCNQAVADGWCVLLVGGPQDQGFNPGYPTLDQYLAILQAIASSTDHVAYLNISESWGAYASSQADGLQVVGSVHPNLAGHGDIASMLFSALNGLPSAGITELVTG
jgi:hypothetical protein